MGILRRHQSWCDVPREKTRFSRVKNWRRHGEASDLNSDLCYKAAKKTHRKSSEQHRKKAWGFTWDETFIDDDANDQGIQEALDIIDREDEFEKFRDQAYSEIGQPTPPDSAESAEDIRRRLEGVAAQLRKRRGPKAADLTKFRGFK